MPIPTPYNRLENKIRGIYSLYFMCYFFFYTRWAKRIVCTPNVPSNSKVTSQSASFIVITLFAPENKPMKNVLHWMMIFISLEKFLQNKEAKKTNAFTCGWLCVENFDFWFWIDSEIKI